MDAGSSKAAHAAATGEGRSAVDSKDAGVGTSTGAARGVSAGAESREAALEAARLIHEHKGEDTVVLDISGASSFADYFVISTARSSAHLSGLHRELQVLLRGRGIRPLNAGHKIGGESGWLLLDCGDLVIHLMEKEQREFYDLERLWFKAERISYWSKSS